MKRQEPRATLRQLTTDNRRALRRMARFLDSYSLNEVALEDLMTDLSGMALECQQRGQAFSQAVGMDERAFCHELVANCPRETFTERVLGFFRWMVAWVGCILPVMYFLEWIFPWMVGSIENGVYLVPLPFLCKYVAAVLSVASGMYVFKRFTYYSQSFVWGLFAGGFLLVFITASEVSLFFARTVVLPLSVTVWMLVFFGLVSFFHIAKRCVALTVAYRQRKK